MHTKKKLRLQGRLKILFCFFFLASASNFTLGVHSGLVHCAIFLQRFDFRKNVLCLGISVSFEELVRQPKSIQRVDPPFSLS